VDLVELPAPAGPLGARGAGEPPAIPGAAAVANALRTITGRRLYTLPFEAEDVAGA
jgi:CO/xanthine dehydrogenase Mo-binding subunit